MTKVCGVEGYDSLNVYYKGTAIKHNNILSIKDMLHKRIGYKNIDSVK